MSALPTVTKSKKRRISPQTVRLPADNAGKRVGPPMIVTQTHFDASDDMMEAKLKNFLWLLAQFNAADDD